MTPDPRVEAVRSAFENARFDERTPDERGFAARFEQELKPELIAKIPEHLRIADMHRWNSRVVVVMFALVAVATFALATLEHQEPRSGADAMTWIVLSACVVGYAVSRRFKEDETLQKKVVGAVLSHFGAEIVPFVDARRRTSLTSPIGPALARIDHKPLAIAGRFEGRIPFVAVRAQARRTRGKSSVVTFRGWHLVADLPFSFTGTTVVYAPNAHHKITYGRKLQTVSLEDPDFSKRFLALSNDQTEARVILTPDVIHHLASSAEHLDRGEGVVMLGFSRSRAHIWIPSNASALSDWKPLHPTKMIEDLHEAFAEMAQIRDFLRDIDVIAESAGFRAQAARQGQPTMPS